MTCTSEPKDTPVTSPREAAVAPRREKSVLRILVMATFVVILNETIMVNAIPRLMAEFEVTARAAQWLSTAFMLSMAVVIPATGWFLQRVTTRRAFLIAMGLFLSGTVLASLAWPFGSVVSALALGLAFLKPNRPASPSTGTEAPLTGSDDLQPQDTVRAG